MDSELLIYGGIGLGCLIIYLMIKFNLIEELMEIICFIIELFCDL